ncbi:hypothetical protein F5Y19DRAFT_69534 [Xylariaceae sp. FL1651]|nr:hypothetical protein F5Y19DRAFT_69534 [Xylariaceae sp. FL1651]
MMQVIVALLALLSFTEAGIVRTPRTVTPNLPPSATTCHSITSSLPSFTMAVATTVSTSHATATEQAPTSDTSDAEGADITAAPNVNLGGIFHEGEAGQKMVQTTYWSCATFPLETHCGWHEPILDTSAANMKNGRDGGIAVRAAIVAGAVVGGLVFGL